MEMGLVALVVGAAILAWLILAKSDKQSVHILEGKLHRLGRSKELALPTWKSHARGLSVAEFVAGFCLALAALLVEGREIAIALGLSGAVLIVLGIAGRLRTFRLADRELG